MAFLNANGVRFHVQRIGAGDRTVVLMHGLVMDNLSSWYYTVANRLAKNSQVILYDFRGHGLSERPRTGYGVQDGVADLRALLDSLEITEPVYLGGNSYGGLIALQFARMYPKRVAGLLLVEAHFPVPGWGQRVASTLAVASEWSIRPETLEWFDERKARHHDRKKIAADDLIDNTSLVADLRDEPPLCDAELARIDIPALAVYGEHSDIIERGRTLGRVMPQCELRVIPDIAHTILMDQPREVGRHIIDWLEKQPVPFKQRRAG
jgi:pimeloyl-ACP methyl ester carboxylesterase